MFNLNDLASAKKKVVEKRVETSGDSYQDAVKALADFEANPDKEILDQAADKLIASLQYNPDHVETYICLAYIFYVLDEDEFAWKYLSKGESLYQDDLPDEILKFKFDVEQNLPWKKKQQQLP